MRFFWSRSTLFNPLIRLKTSFLRLRTIFSSSFYWGWWWCVCAVLLILSLLFVLERTVIYIFYNMNRNIPFPGTSSSQFGCDVLPVWACAVLPGGCSPDDRWPSWEREHPGKGPVELPSSAWIARFGDPIDWLQRESETKRDPESSYRINFLNQQTDSMYSSAN